MKSISNQIIEIPIDEVSGIDELFGKMMKISPENVQKFKDYYKTREDSYNNFTIKAIYESLELEEIRNDKIILTGGIVIENKLLSKVFYGSSELLFCVIALSGYEYLEEAEDDIIYKLLLDGWGTAFVEMAYKWLKKEISYKLEKMELHTTHSFSPGQNGLPLDMQKFIFEYLEPSKIGATLNCSYMMHPQKSISGIIGIGSCNSESGISPCDLCERRATCSSAYMDKELENKCSNE